MNAIFKEARRTMQKIIACYQRITPIFQPAGDALLLIMRLWMANIFWKSGILKISSWDSTIQLFTYEHPVPFLPPLIAAIFGTFFELVCPILLTLGLGVRFAVLPLLAMTAVIQFTYLEATEHMYWAFLLGAIFCFGAGRLSADHLLARRFNA